jgi:hypothetical protein
MIHIARNASDACRETDEEFRKNLQCRTCVDNLKWTGGLDFQTMSSYNH